MGKEVGTEGEGSRGLRNPSLKLLSSLKSMSPGMASLGLRGTQYESLDEEPSLPVRPLIQTVR